MPSEPGWSGSAASTARPALGELPTGTRCTVAAERLDHHAAVRLLVVADAPTCQTSHSRPNSAQAKASAVPHWPAPVSVVSLLHARLGVVVRLRHGGVRLVRAGRADALVLVVDPGRGAERLLEPVGPEQRRRPPQPVDVEHLAGDLDVALRARPPADERPSGTAARGRRGRPARRVPGCSGGGGGLGRSGTMLYQAVGISDSSRMILCWRTVSSMVRPLYAGCRST